MSGAIYGGDEIGALVIDIGSFSSRIGFAGQDRPEIDIPTFMGFRETGQFNCGDPKFPSYLCGTTKINCINEHMEIVNPIKNGEISNWSAYEALINNLICQELHLNSEEHPYLFYNKETVGEIFFERFGVPALYLTKSPVLTSFAHAKYSSLVVDCGHSYCSVTAVIDGYALKKSTIHIPIAGSYITEKSLEMLRKMDIDLTCNYKIASKQVVSEREEPVYQLKSDEIICKESWKDYMLRNLVRDFSYCVYQVSDIPINDNYHKSAILYEFPTGYYQSFYDERYKISELLFETNIVDGEKIEGIHKMILECIKSCDVDIRNVKIYGKYKILLSNIAICGGTSLFPGYIERLQHSLSNILSPNMKYKVLTSYAGDRRFAPWVGGSILASMGTFNQLWISKAEYLESGHRAVETRCA